MVLRGSQWLYQSLLECRSCFDGGFQGFSRVLLSSLSGSQGLSAVLSGSQWF